MRHIATASLLALSLTAPLASAQSDQPVEARVGRLEKEMRAVQRKVFPGGAPLEPEIRAPQAPQAAPGSPATAPIADLTARVDALERQLADITGQTEQNSYKIKQLEDAFNRYKTDMDARNAPAVVAPPVVSTAPVKPTPASAATAPAPRPANAATGDARTTAVAAIERPDTGDAANDAYTYGFRLWSSKFYPEAQAQLKATVDKYGTTSIASRSANLLGRAYLDDGKPAQAAVTLYENYQKRPSGDRAADSLAWLGEALIQLKKLPDACKVYEELQQNYGSNLATGLRDMMAKGRTRAKCG